MHTCDFEFDLPDDLIAQTPANQRDQSKLMILSRQAASLEHRSIQDLPLFLDSRDVLVINNSRVIKARLRGTNARTGGRFELLLLRENAPNDWWAMVKPGRRATQGTAINLLDPSANVTGISATVLESNAEGHRRFQFHGTPDITGELPRLGELPLPPYIRRAAPNESDEVRYQTVYAKTDGSLAAPTAGLHFTPALMNRIQANGVQIAEVTLHVGLGTFAPVKAESLDQHVMHEERFFVSDAAANLIETARTQGGRIVAVGTTSMRVLESVARANHGRITPGPGTTRLFLHPPADFLVVNALLTNFHLPRSTLLMLVSAFATPGRTEGRALMLNAYAEAVRNRYRFFSYGDAMLIR